MPWEKKYGGGLKRYIGRGTPSRTIRSKSRIPLEDCLMNVRCMGNIRVVLGGL